MERTRSSLIYILNNNKKDKTRTSHLMILLYFMFEFLHEIKATKVHPQLMLQMYHKDDYHNLAERMYKQFYSEEKYEANSQKDT